LYDSFKKQYTKSHGKKVIICMQVGAFYEIYGEVTDDETCEMNILCDLLGLYKTKAPHTKNIWKMGFKITNTLRWETIAMNNNYALVYINEVKDKNLKDENKMVRRFVDKIVTPSSSELIFRNDRTESYLCSIYIETVPNKTIENYCINNELKLLRKCLMIGISFIDLSTGSSLLFYVDDDTTDSLLELKKMIKIYNSVEYIINLNYIQNIDFNKEQFINFLNINDKKIDINFMSKDTDKLKKLKKSGFQTKFLSDVYQTPDVIEHLNICTMPQLIISLTILLDYCRINNKNLIYNLTLPKVIKSNKRLYLEEDIIRQLNLLSNNHSFLDYNSNKKINSLYAAINNTKTPMGKRLLKHRLISPTSNITVMRNRYNLIESILPHTPEITHILKQIKGDLCKIHRLLNMGRLDPYKLYKLYYTYDTVYQLFYYCINNIKSDKKIVKKEILEVLNVIREDMIEKFDLTVIEQISNKYFDTEIDITKSIVNIFNVGFDNELDRMKNTIDGDTVLFTKITKILSLMLLDGNETKYNSVTTKPVEIKTDRRNKKKCLKMTPTRYKKLLNIINNLDIDDKCLAEIEDRDLKQTVFDFISNLPTYRNESTKTTIKIYNKNLNNDMDSIISKYKTYLELMRERYLQYCENLSAKMNILTYITDSIANIDVGNSGAQCVLHNKYCKPIIKQQKDSISSYINAKGLRHPIIERVREDVEYISNDIYVGFDKSMIVYGLNSSGKSSLAKALIICIIMAQAGMYVACDELVFYPYKSILVKISTEDNIFKGESSYIFELKKIKKMITNSNDNTLIFADELCNTTEQQSAIGMVCSTINSLINDKCTFIFTSHLHEVKNNSIIKMFIQKGNLLLKHLHTEIDIRNDKKIILYSRKLADGPGAETYGLEVANYVGLGSDFMHIAYDVREEFMKLNFEYKQSNYNKQLFMNGCELCKNKNCIIHTHHINEQHTADDNGFIGKFHKNKKHNLLVVCNECHDKIHNGKIIIDGFKDTNKGRIIDYHMNDEN
jgi:DNA mismatch repair protein MutS